MKKYVKNKLKDEIQKGYIQPMHIGDIESDWHRLYEIWIKTISLLAVKSHRI